LCDSPAHEDERQSRRLEPSVPIGMQALAFF
jgi:hypothetical protein